MHCYEKNTKTNYYSQEREHNLKAKKRTENNANATMRILSATSNELLFRMYFEKVLNLNSICVYLIFCRIPVLFNR